MVGFFFTNRREVKRPRRPSFYSHRGRVTFWVVFNTENEDFRLWRTEWIWPEMCLKVESAAMCLRSGRSVCIFLLGIECVHSFYPEQSRNEERGTCDHDRCGLGVSHCPALAQEPYPYFLVDGTRLYSRRKCPGNPWSCCVKAERSVRTLSQETSWNIFYIESDKLRVYPYLTIQQGFWV